MGNGWDAGVGCLIDAGGSESLVNGSDEINVIEVFLGVTSLVFLGKRVVLILSEVKVQL